MRITPVTQTEQDHFDMSEIENFQDDLTEDDIQNRRVQIFQPINLIKQKVGNGGIDEQRIINAQRLIDECSSDIFVPMAEELCSIIQELIALTKSEGILDGEKLIEDFAANFVQIRANGTMFKYPLMSRIAENALHFLEYIPALDMKAVEVLEAHHTTMQIVLKTKLDNNNANKGKELQKALVSACSRYFKNHMRKKQLEKEQQHLTDPTQSKEEKLVQVIKEDKIKTIN